MAEFTVSEVVDGDTFKVKNGWKWDNKTGDTVRPTGYDAPEKGERYRPFICVNLKTCNELTLPIFIL